jgi:hypothetical protein
MGDWRFPTHYCLFIRIRVKQDKFPQFKTGATKVAAAFHQHETSRPWAAYSTVAGPGLYAYLLLPLGDLSDLDGMEPLEKVMQDVYGTEGLSELAIFRESILEMDTSVLADLSTGLPPVESGAKPPEYLFYTSISLQADKVSRFLAASRKAVAAQGEAVRWFAYGTFAGRNRIHGFAASETIGGLASVSQAEAMVEAKYGRQEGREIMSELQGALSDAESSILRYMGHHND